MNAGPDLSQLSEVVVAAMARLHVPGVAVGILNEGRQQVAGFGVTNIEHPLPVDAATLFQIGSITKTFTGTAAMRLVEQGTLGLDTPLRAYLPALRLADEETAARVTLRHLFTHTAGWVGDFFEDLGSGDDALARYVAAMVDLPQLTPVGEVWSYNNAGYSLAGRVIEVVTGQTYEAALRTLVLDPLGLTHAFLTAEEVITHRVVAGHHRRDEVLAVARPWALPRTANAAGALITSVPDLLRYARFHLGDGRTADGTRLLSAATMALMQSPLVPVGSFAQGLTWRLTDMGGVTTVSHGGLTNGQAARFTLAPARNFAVVVLANAGHGAELNGEVTNWALRHYLNLTRPETPPLALPAARLAPYAGRYTSVMHDVELTLDGDGLVMAMIPKGGFPTRQSPPLPKTPLVRLALYGDDAAVMLDAPLHGERGEFGRAPDGGIAWFRVWGRIHLRQD